MYNEKSTLSTYILNEYAANIYSIQPLPMNGTQADFSVVIEPHLMP